MFDRKEGENHTRAPTSIYLNTPRPCSEKETSELSYTREKTCNTKFIPKQAGMTKKITLVQNKDDKLRFK